jgi:hypothetical protein
VSPTDAKPCPYLADGPTKVAESSVQVMVMGLNECRSLRAPRTWVEFGVSRILLNLIYCKVEYEITLVLTVGFLLETSDA